MFRHTTFRVGGPAEALFRPDSVDDLSRAVAFAREIGVPLTIIGAGSNLLVRDEGIPGLITQIAGMPGEIVADDSGRVRLAAGRHLSRCVAALAHRGVAGLEALAGIPGTLGGAVWMNAGAHGTDISSYLLTVTAMTPDGLETTPKENLEFSYRRSGFIDFPDAIILSAEFQLIPDDPLRIDARRKEFLAERKTKQPVALPSAGSFFKNPPGGPAAGRLIDDAGCKGMRFGGAVVSEMHANFIGNAGGATCDDVLRLAARVRRIVHERFGVELEFEVKVTPA